MPSSETDTAQRTDQLVELNELVGGVSADEFRSAFRNHAAGVAVITADAGGGPVAMTATSVFSVSATPPLLVFSVSSLSSATPTILKSTSVVVHLLDASNVELARLCATSGVDRFADGTSWSRLPGGEPFYLNVGVRVRGDVVNVYEAGASRLVVVHVTDVHFSGRTAKNGPLVYHDRHWYALNADAQLE